MVQPSTIHSLDFRPIDFRPSVLNCHPQQYVAHVVFDIFYVKNVFREL
jgi:hypothetical protein